MEKEGSMDADSWLWVALIAFLVFCCLPMVLMGRGKKQSNDSDRGEDVRQPSGVADKNTRQE